MERNILAKVTTAMMVVGLLWPQVGQAYSPMIEFSAENWNYEVVAKADDAVITQGQGVILWASLRNDGYQPWSRDQVHLGTVRPMDRNSGFYTSENWIASNRTQEADESQAKTGEVMNFGFWATAPDDMDPGNYTECFAPVVENYGWMADKNICFNIKVIGEKKTYAAVPENNQTVINMQAGEERVVTLGYQNTGTATWKRFGSFPTHLAVTYDANGNLYQSEWLSKNRPAELMEDEVLPGHIGHFSFKVKVPTNAVPGTSIADNFWLVSEGRAWFIDSSASGWYSNLKVNVVANPEYVKVVENMSTALKDVKSFRYDGRMMNGNDQYKGNFNIDFEGTIDANNEDKPMSQMLLNMMFMNSIPSEIAQDVNIKFETRQIGDKSYFRIDAEQLMDDSLDSNIASKWEKLNNQWILIDKDSMKQWLEDMGLGEQWTEIEKNLDELESNQTEEEKQQQIDQIAELIKPYRVFMITDKMGAKEINGVQTTQYKFVINTDELQSMLNAIDKVTTASVQALKTGKTLATFDLNDLNQLTDDTSSNSEAKIEISGSICIGDEDHLPYNIIGNISPINEPLTDESMLGHFSFEINFSDFNEKLNVTTPSPVMTISEAMEIIMTQEIRTEAYLNQEFVIEEISNPTTGYYWEVKEMTDSSILKMTGDDYTSDCTENEMIAGCGGMQKWMFEPVKVGETTFTIEYRRNWEENVAPLSAKKYIIKVIDKDMECKDSDPIGTKCGGGIKFADGKVAMPGGCGADVKNPGCDGVDTNVMRLVEYMKHFDEFSRADKGASNTDGQFNTFIYVSSGKMDGVSYPVPQYCYDMQYKGYDNWYLPAIDELKEMYNQKNLIGGFNTRIYDSAYDYFSSTLDENNKNTNVLGLSFMSSENGKEISMLKDAKHLFRCVRKY